MLQEIKQEMCDKMSKSIDSLNQEFLKLRTGRPHPNLLDQVQVDYYGSLSPMSQVASVTVSGSNSLLISPWDKTMLKAIEKAIRDSDLGLNPVTSGVEVRVTLPALTEERRKEIIKIVNQLAEKARVSIRQSRRESIKVIDKMLKDKEITEDDQRKIESQIQTETDSFIKNIDHLMKQKEQEITKV